MQPEDIFESIAVALPFFILAAVFYALAAWKKKKGRGLHVQAQQLLAEGNDKEACQILQQALWKANEDPGLERGILEDLGGLYQKAGVDFRPDDYEVLILQFEQLSKKGSYKAIAEMKKVQALKVDLIERMPKVA